MKITFVMATVDPKGNSTTGIVRAVTNNSYSIGSDYSYKDISRWPTDKYLNIWIVSVVPPYVGFGTPPFMTDQPAGVTISYKAFEYSPYPFTKGRTLTHEVGHFFGLLHIWGYLDDCSDDDGIDDTPRQDKATSGLPLVRTKSCDPILFNMFENYMDYTNDDGMNMFTAQQVDVMTKVAMINRSGLVNNAATIDTQIVSGKIEKADSVVVVNMPEIITGIEQETTSVKIWNEGSDVVIDVPEANKEAPIIVYSMQGSVVGQGMGSCRISLAGQATGIYLVVGCGIAKRVFRP